MPVIETILATVTVAELVQSVAGARTDRAICAALGVAWGGFRRYKKVDSDRLQTALRRAYVESCAELAASLQLSDVAKQIRGADWVPEGLLGEISQLYAEPDPQHPIDDKLREAVLKDLELDLRVWAPEEAVREQILIGARQGWHGAGSLREAISAKFRAEVDRDDSTVGTLWLRDTLAGAAKALEELKLGQGEILGILGRILERLNALDGRKAPSQIVRLDARPTGLVERPGLMEWLDGRISRGDGPTLLWGEPGSGKSTLALELGWRAAGEGREVVQQFCGQGRGVQEVGVALAGRLPGHDAQAPPESQIEWARNLLRERGALLILDDVWDEALMGLAPGPPARVVYTSRRKTFGPLRAEEVRRVGGFETSETAELLEERLPGWLAKHGRELRDLATKVEDLPLALEVATGLLMLSERPERQAIEHVHGLLGGEFELYRDAARAHTPEAQRLLLAVALCAQEGVWLPFAAELAEVEEGAVWDAVEALADAALLRTADREAQVFGVHAVMREALAEEAKGLEELRVKALERMFGEWDEDRGQWEDCARVLGEADAAVRWLARDEDNARFSRLSHQSFELAYRTGRLLVGQHFLKQQEARYEASNDRAGLQRSYGNQALILQDWGRLDEAMKLHQREENICEDLGDRAGLQASYGNQALILKAWGRLDEAMKLHQREETICEELGDRAGLQRSYGNQALILKAWGRLDEAMKLLQRQQAICEELGDRAGLARCHGNQGNVLQQFGQVEEARVAMGKALEIFRSLGMPRERDQAQLLLDEMGPGTGAAER